jgi:hypothetical protein
MPRTRTELLQVDSLNANKVNCYGDQIMNVLEKCEFAFISDRQITIPGERSMHPSIYLFIYPCASFQIGPPWTSASTTRYATSSKFSALRRWRGLHET